MNEPKTHTPERLQTTPAQWAVVLVVVLASWEVGQTVVRWLYSYVVPQLVLLSPGGPGRFSDLLWTVVFAVLSALVAAPLAYFAVQLLLRRMRR
jgi:hypothetical protein